MFPDISGRPNQNVPMLIIGGVVVVALVVGAYLLFGRPSASPSDSKVTDAHIQVTKDGFLPATLTVKAGTTVSWLNNDRAPHKVASNPHPQHTDLPGLVSAILKPQETFSYTFSEAGTFGFHDHLNPTVGGAVIVQ